MALLNKKIYRATIAALLTTSINFITNATEPDVDPFELDLETNLNSPIVPSKKQTMVKESIDKLKLSLEKAGFKSNRLRQGEALTFTIPCEQLFRANESELSKQGRDILSKLKFPTDLSGKYKLLIAVHSDDTGEQQYADALTAARANAIDDFITANLQGVELIIVPYGLGHDDPAVSNNSVLNRAKNRRADFFLVPTSELFTK